MPWEYPHMPEAGNERRRWDREVQSLTGQLNELTAVEAGLNAETTVINNAANVHLPNRTNYLPTRAVGDYRDEYETKVDQWLTSARDIRTRFDTIGNDLAIRIRNVQAEITRTNVALAAARANVTHFQNLMNVRVWRD